MNDSRQSQTPQAGPPPEDRLVVVESLPTEQDQQQFFARLDAQLDELPAGPEPAWKAHTVGLLALRPQLLPVVIGVCSLFLVASIALTAFSTYKALNPVVPPYGANGYMLVRTSGGKLVAVADRTYLSPEQDQLRRDAVAELNALLKEETEKHPGDVTRVSATNVVPQP